MPNSLWGSASLFNEIVNFNGLIRFSPEVFPQSLYFDLGPANQRFRHWILDFVVIVGEEVIFAATRLFDQRTARTATCALPFKFLTRFDHEVIDSDISSRSPVTEEVSHPNGSQLSLVTAHQADAAPETQFELDLKNNIADCFLHLAALPTFPLDRLSRYEHLLWRQARQIVFTLESLRRSKQAQARSTFPFSFRRRAPGVLSEEFR